MYSSLKEDLQSKRSKQSSIEEVKNNRDNYIKALKKINQFFYHFSKKDLGNYGESESDQIVKSIACEPGFELDSIKNISAEQILEMISLGPGTSGVFELIRLSSRHDHEKELPKIKGVKLIVFGLKTPIFGEDQNRYSSIYTVNAFLDPKGRCRKIVIYDDVGVEYRRNEKAEETSKEAPQSVKDSRGLLARLFRRK